MGDSNKDLLFITSVSLINRDNETRRKVRSHARRQKLGAETKHSPATVRRPQKEHTSRFKLVSPTTKGSPNQLRGRHQASPSASDHTSGSDHTSDDGHEFKDEHDDLDPRLLRPLDYEFAVSVIDELPTPSLLSIPTTDMGERLLKNVFAVCLSPKEQFVHKWFDKCQAPTYMDKYHSSFIAQAFSMNPTGSFFDFMHIDLAITHAFMAMVASTHNSFSNWKDTRTLDYHRFHAIKCINQRLDSEGKSGLPVSDGTVIAVSLLVSIDSYMGLLQAAAAHMNGLKMMVDMRGGLIHGFGYSTLMQRSLSWADYAFATSAARPLTFPFVPELAESLSLGDRTVSDGLDSETLAGKSDSLCIQSSKALEALELLRAVTITLNTFDYSNLSGAMTERVQISDSIYLVEFQLCTFEEEARQHQIERSLGASPASDSGNAIQLVDLSEPLVYASHLFLHCAIRGQPPTARRHMGLSQGLLWAVWDLGMFKKDGSLAIRWGDRASGPSAAYMHSNVLLWILFIGASIRVPIENLVRPDSRGIFGSSMDISDFFIQALRAVLSYQGITEIESLKSRLQEVVWLASWCDNVLDMVWERLQGEASP